MDKHKLYRELLVVLFAFFLTTVIGGWFQNRIWERQRDDDLLQSEYRLAESTFSEISTMMDDRLYQIKEIILSYKYNRKDSVFVEKMWEDYDVSSRVWNRNVNKNFALLNRYFGKELYVYYEKKIYGFFVYFDDQLKKIRYSGLLSDDEMNKLEDELNVLSNMIYKYDLTLLNALKRK